MDISVLTKKNPASGYSSEEMTNLAASLETIGPVSQTFVFDRMDRSDFVWEKPYLYAAFIKAAQAVKNLLNGNTVSIVDLFRDASASAEFNFGEYLIPVLLDIRDLQIKSRVIITPEMNEVINQFKANVFRDLPFEELMQSIHFNLLFFLSRVDMVLQFKHRYVLDDGMYMNDWNKGYLFAIENNEEVIGAQSITVDGKQQPPFVKNWLKDYLVTIPASVTGRGALEEAQYFSKSPNILKLTIEDKKTLQELIQFYDWLLHPSGTFEELEAYEAAQAREESRTQTGVREIKVGDLQKPTQPFRSTPGGSGVPPQASPAPLPNSAFTAPANTRSIQDILLDRTRPAGDPRTVARPAPAPARAGNKPVQTLDVDARLAQLRNKVKKQL